MSVPRTKFEKIMVPVQFDKYVEELFKEMSLEPPEYIERLMFKPPQTWNKIDEDQI